MYMYVYDTTQCLNNSTVCINLTSLDMLEVLLATVYQFVLSCALFVVLFAEPETALEFLEREKEKVCVHCMLINIFLYQST